MERTERPEHDKNMEEESVTATTEPNNDGYHVAEDIDSKLEERAASANMSVQNVKSLIHHVIKDKRVISLAKKLANEEISDEEIDIVPFEPRLTRSRVREAVTSSVTNPNFTPEKSNRPKQTPTSLSTPQILPTSTSVLDAMFSVDSSNDEEDDEEYSPGRDSTEKVEETLIESDLENDDDDTEIEEEEEVSVSMTTPTEPQADDEDDDEIAVQEAASLLASLSDVSFTPLKLSEPILTPPVINTDSFSEQETKIAQRTRSKLPLVDTDIQEIEASFNPPDVPSDDDLTAPHASQEYDDELEWQKWLADLMNPQCLQLPVQDDQEDDTEYNVWAENLDYEKEEFRTDRAVKIPQREVDELIEELLNPNYGILNTNTVTDPSSLSLTDSSTSTVGTAATDLTSVYLLESLGLRPPVLSHNQAAVSKTHQREHQSKKEETVPAITDTSWQQYLSQDQALQVFDQLQQHFQLLMQTFVMTRFEPSLVFLSQIASRAIDEIGRWCKEATEDKNSPLWYVPGLDEALQLVTKYNPDDQNAAELVTCYGNPPKVPDIVQDIIMNTGIFWQYPQYIPEIGLSPVKGSQCSKYFTTSEDYLLVLGMDHYGSSSWKMIQEKLLPMKTPKQLHLRVKNLSSSRMKTDNAIKYYRRTGMVKLPLDKDITETVKLPQWVLKYHTKREQAELKEKEKREKRLEELRNIAKPYCLIAPTKPAQSVATSTAATIGSKRNLAVDLLAAVESTTSSKRLKEGETSDQSTSSRRGRKQRASPVLEPILYNSHTNTDADYTQLLYMAGLEGSEPSARYAFNYLTEVKATVMDSPGTYDAFIKLLVKAHKKEWSAGKLYMAIKPVLQPWPHLLKLFMAFLDPKDAVQANVIADKIDYEQIKAFIDNLKDKYSDSPLQLNDIFSRLRLCLSSQEDVTRNQMLMELTDVIQAHEDLLCDLRHFLTGTLPAKKIAASSHDDFEEVNFTETRQVDDFEEVTMPDEWTPQQSPTVDTAAAIVDSTMISSS